MIAQYCVEHERPTNDLSKHRESGHSHIERRKHGDTRRHISRHDGQNEEREHEHDVIPFLSCMHDAHDATFIWAP